MDIFMQNATNNPIESCFECGSICLVESQFTMTLNANTYLLKINGPHQFEMICTPKTDTDSPTPITKSPTLSPTKYPPPSPTTSAPTKSTHPVFNASFPFP